MGKGYKETRGNDENVSLLVLKLIEEYTYDFIISMYVNYTSIKNKTTQISLC